MHSFIVLGKNKAHLQDTIEAICTKNIHTIDRTHFSFEKSIGIEDIRSIQKNLSLSPIKGPQKAVIIWNAQTLTIPAQNALLKTLEEPPRNTLILLVADNKDAFLTTILSRCSIRETSIKERKTPISDTNTELFLEKITIGEKLYLAQVYGKNKETAITWINQVIQQTRDEMIRLCTKEKAVLLRMLQETSRQLTQTNTSPRLILEHMLLSLI